MNKRVSNMKGLPIIILSGILFGSCAKTNVDFLIQQSDRPSAPAAFSFENTSDECDSYYWDFGDGFSSTEKSPEHTYYLSGKYSVVLKGTVGKKTKEVARELVVSPPEKCLVQMQTEFGNLLIELYDQTPKHRDNFLKLAEAGFYDGLLFHRVINEFMIQGGDPESRGAEPAKRLGSGGPGYTIEAEFNESLAHVKGALAAARTGDAVNPQKRSSGSQFYIVQGREVTTSQLDQIESRLGIAYPEAIKAEYEELGGTPYLDQNYTVFGRVLDGMDIIDKIAGTKTMPGDRPEKDITMKIKVIK